MNSGRPNRIDIREPGSVRGQAGSWLEDELLAEGLGPILAVAIGVAMLLGGGVYRWFGGQTVLLAGAVSLLGAALFWVAHRRSRDALRKGHIAERQIGRALEQAITAKACAVAHNVTGVMESGDIDHIVVTRAMVWVIETKYRRVPKGKFHQVISRLHACRRRLETLLPSGTPVQPCLVLAYEGEGVKRERDGVLVWTNETFQDFLWDLRAERNLADGIVGIEPSVARMIWRLGRGESLPPVNVREDPGENVESNRSAASAPARLDEVRARHPKAYERWTPEDDRRLQDLYEAGWDEADLASEFARQPSAIRSRLRKLG